MRNDGNTSSLGLFGPSVAAPHRQEVRLAVETHRRQIPLAAEAGAFVTDPADQR